MIGNFENIGKMIQDVTNNVKAQPGALGGIGAAAGKAAGFAQGVAGEMQSRGSHMGGIGSAIGKAAEFAQRAVPGGPVQMAASGVGAAASLAGRMAAQAAATVGPAVQKAGYIAILHEAIAGAEKSQPFNLDSHKGALMSKLGNLSPANLKQTQLGQAMAQVQDQQGIEKALKAVNDLSRKMAQSSQQIVNNLR
jgi:hypothetical protein